MYRMCPALRWPGKNGSYVLFLRTLGTQVRTEKTEAGVFSGLGEKRRADVCVLEERLHVTSPFPSTCATCSMSCGFSGGGWPGPPNRERVQRPIARVRCGAPPSVSTGTSHAGPSRALCPHLQSEKSSSHLPGI